MTLRLAQRTFYATLLVALTGEDDAHKGIASLARDDEARAYVAELQKDLEEAAKDLLDDKPPTTQNPGADPAQDAIEALHDKVEDWLKKQPGA